MIDREERIKIYKETIDACDRGCYEINGDRYTFFVEGDSEYYSKPIEEVHPWNVTTEVSVVNEDCLYAAERISKDHQWDNVTVLNMASFAKPGGGVLKGSAAQEEDLFRRTDLSQALYKFDRAMAEKFNVPFQTQAYPLDLNHGVIISEDINILREGADKNYAFKEEIIDIGVVTVAALRKPDVKAKSYEEITKNKIRAIFNGAIIMDTEHLVLGAFGCGAYGNPPEIMARLFHEVLKEDLYRRMFKSIVFAILDDHNARKEHNPDGNFAPFAKEFENGI